VRRSDLLANAVCHAIWMALTHRIREQARSHILNNVQLEKLCAVRTLSG